MMMSVKSAREHCGYNAKPILPVCGNCAAFASDKVLPAWMEDDNKYVGKQRYNVDEHGVEKNLRCLDHGFAVKKMANCKLFRAKKAKP